MRIVHLELTVCDGVVTVKVPPPVDLADVGRFDRDARILQYAVVPFTQALHAFRDRWIHVGPVRLREMEADLTQLLSLALHQVRREGDPPLEGFSFSVAGVSER